MELDRGVLHEMTERLPKLLLKRNGRTLSNSMIRQCRSGMWNVTGCGQRVCVLENFPRSRSVPKAQASSGRAWR